MDGFRCVRCTNWTDYCDDCKNSTRLRAHARQKALKQLQRRYPDEYADIYQLEKVKALSVGRKDG